MTHTVAILGDTILNNEPLGIQRYAYELLRELDSMQLGFDCELIIPANKKSTIKFKNIKIVQYGSIQNAFLWRQICYPSYVRKKKAISVDFTLGLIPLACDVVCLHDCIYEEYPGDFIGIKAKLKRLSYLFRARLISKKAKKLITVSKFSKKRIEKHYHRSDIIVIPNSWQHFNRITVDEDVLTEFHLKKGQYGFSLGSSLPHKNIKWLLAAAAQNPDIQFVITGTDRLSSYQRELKIDSLNNIKFTGYLSDAKVKALMQNCKVFLHPSFYEGFGIPPMEAMSCGAKCIVSSKTSLPEIYRKSVWYIDPNNYGRIDLNEIMAQSIDNNDAVLSAYSWQQSAHRLVRLISEMVQDS